MKMRLQPRSAGFIGSKTASSTRARVRGASLVEYMIGIAVGGLVLAIIAPLCLYSGFNFAGLANYVELNTSSVNALDQMSKDIRQAIALTNYAANQLTFIMASNQPALTFTYDPASRTLVRQQGTDSKTLLTGCDSLKFSIYQRTPIPGTYDQYPTATATNCKVVAVNWVCSRSILGNRLNTESEQTAKIVIRKH